MKRRKGELNVFSMSFLDAITAGFGCVVLLFMLVSANAVLDQRTVVENREAEARRWELRVLTGQRNLVQLREALVDSRFQLAETMEVLNRTWHIEGQAVRPDHRMVAHTGFLTHARLLGA